MATRSVERVDRPGKILPTLVRVTRPKKNSMVPEFEAIRSARNGLTHGTPETAEDQEKTEFFAASDAVAFQRVRSPMCLSHHPRSPMTQEEVLELARARTADPE